MFDETRLDDEGVLATADLRLRGLAESGARVRREALALTDASATLRDRVTGRPRAVIAAGPDSRLLRAVLEPTCPVPLVAWPSAGLPGWAGSLDLVVVLAPDGGDPATAAAVSEASRRGCQVLVAAPAASLVAEHVTGTDSFLVPTQTRDQLAVAVAVLSLLADLGLGPATDPDQIAAVLDDVAVECSPHRELTTNVAKLLALSLGDATPLVWGGSMLAARAARRVAEALRRASGRAVVAGETDQLLPVLEAAEAASIFDDPFDSPAAPKPVLVVLDDGVDEPAIHEQRRRLTAVADQRNLRVELISADSGGDVARYAHLVLVGTYASEYLRLGTA
ncbi:SIS domain-containing protein [Nocardioides sp. Kera G14]|uniref:SIS domain-containing protein n=1 Tax=Nocardioides sp. Kera G14 TaxID=2884264 RepID=UPI001D105759|nr:SIS domain-containing protein [Nocardioides sp. Kera G14]UDY22741.1 hypothetical protein LH076_11760 [Nocardioides sp. Kera G14]